MIKRINWRRDIAKAFRKINRLVPASKRKLYSYASVLFVVLFLAVSTLLTPNDYYQVSHYDFPDVKPVSVELSEEAVKGELLLNFNDGISSQEKLAYLESINAELVYDFEDTNSMLVKVSDESVVATINSEIVNSEPNYFATIQADYPEAVSDEDRLNTKYIDTPADVDFGRSEYPSQWALEKIGYTRVNPVSTVDVKEKVVAVIDTGVCLDNPSLEGKLVDGWDFVDNDSLAQDELNHGCAVAGIIAADIEKGEILGIAPNAKIMPLKVIDNEGKGTYSDLAAAIIFAANQKAEIINISVGGNFDSVILKRAIDYATAKGSVIVAAAGNTSSNSVLYPAVYENVISVGSVGRNLVVNSFSSRSEKVDFWAPGEAINSLSLNHSTEFFSGTSFAAPYISGLLVNLAGIDVSQAKGGFLTSSGEKLLVNFELIDDEVIGWGDSIVDPVYIVNDPNEQFITPQYSTPCVSRYSQGWWSGAQCHIEGIWQTNTSPYQYKIVTQGRTYNFIISNAAHFLGSLVRLNVTYTGQYSFRIDSINTVNRAPIGHFDAVDPTSLLISGWAFDPDHSSSSIYVRLIVVPQGGTAKEFFALADKPRQDVNSYYGVSGNHGFTFKIPNEYTSGNHTFYMYGLDTTNGSATQLTASPKTINIIYKGFQAPANQIVSFDPGKLKTYGYHLPQGYRADIINIANQSISAIPHQTPADPVNTANGFLDHTVVDLKYPEVAGVPFEFRRTYNSDSKTVGILGVGWRTSYDIRVIANNFGGYALWTVLFPDGHGQHFEEPDYDYRFFSSTLNAISPESKGNLTRNANSSWDFTYKDKQTGQTFVFFGNGTSPKTFGKVKKITYPNGAEVDLQYDSNGYLVKVNDARYGREFNLSNDSSGRISFISDKSGRKVKYSYLADNHISDVWNPLDGKTTYTYIAAAGSPSTLRIKTITDPNGIKIEDNTYDSLGRVLSIKDGRNNTRTYAYTTSGTDTITTLTDQEGGITRHRHNNKNYLLEVIKPNGDTSKYEYNNRGDRIKETLPNGKVYNYEYDEKGNRTLVVNPDGKSTAITYNSAGKPLQIKEDGNNRIKTFQYDPVTFNLTKETDPLGKSIIYNYNAEGQLISTIDKVTTFEPWTEQFSYTENWRVDRNLRLLGDVNGDGKDDIIGFADNGTHVSLSEGDDFEVSQRWHDRYGYNDGWNINTHVRMIGDVDGNGIDDFVNISTNHVAVSISNGTKFLNATAWLWNSYSENTGWRVNRNPRMLADVNGDGKVDLIGFHENEVKVSLSTGTNFTSMSNWLTDFTIGQGWEVNNHPRYVADVNGDGKADIVGFGPDGVYVSLSDGSQFLPKTLWSSNFATNSGWNNPDHIRTVADIDGNGIYDIVGFGENSVEVEFSTGNSFANKSVIDTRFVSAAGNWTIDKDVRLLGDIDGDGIDDVVGFGNTGVYVNNYNNGATTYQTYDSNGYINSNSTIGASIVKTTYVNDVLGNILQETDPLGNTTSHTYNSLNQKTSQTDSRGGVTQNYYDLLGNLIREVNALGVETFYTYDNNYNLIKIQTGDRIQLFEYNGNGLKTKETDPKGNYVVHAYDSTGRNVSSEYFDASGVLLSNNSRTYYPGEEIATETDSNGVETSYQYNSMDLVTSVTRSGQTRTMEYDFWGNIISESDFEGNITRYTFDGQNQLLTKKNVLEDLGNGSGEQYKYDANGNLVELTNTLGHTTKLEYDNFNRLLSTTNSQNQTSSNKYDKVGNLIENVSFGGTITTMTYDSVGNLLSKIDHLGNQSTFEYNLNNLKTKETDARNHSTSFNYDQYDQITSEVNQIGHVKVYSYDLTGNVLTQTDEENRTQSFEYDGLGRLIATNKNSIVDGVNTTTTERNEYDGNNNIVKKIDAKGQATTYTFDDFNRTTRITHPDESFVYSTYSPNGNLLSKRDERGEVANFIYDKLNRLTKEINPLGHQKTYTYNPSGEVLEESDFKGQKTIYEYDSLGNQTKITDRLGQISQLEYDLDGRLLKIIYPNNLVEEFTYDAVGRKIKESRVATDLPEPLNDEYSYDEIGNLINKKDAKGNQTTYIYDQLNRKTAEIMPLNVRLDYTYDKSGKLISEKDPNGNFSYYTYTPDGKIRTKTDAMGFVTTFNYDANGNLIKKIDPLNNVESYTYDSRNRQTSTIAPDGTVSTKTEFDEVGNVVRKFDGNNNLTQYFYDPANRIASVTDPTNGVITYIHDNNGNLNMQTNQQGIVVSYSYDALDRVVNKTDEKGQIWGYSFNSMGKLTGTIDPNNKTDINEYDSLGRRVKSLFQSDSLGLVETVYSHDNLGNVIGVTDANGNTTSYEYNELSRNTKITNSEGKTKLFNYDPNGNVTQVIDENGNATTSAYDANNRLLTETDSLNTTIQYEYDPNGNVTKAINQMNSARTYTYDSKNRLATYKNAINGNHTYVYDANDNLVEEVNPLGGIETYTYDSLNRKLKATGGVFVREDNTYDSLGRVVKTKDGLGNDTNYEYDTLGRLLNVTDAEGGVTRYEYDVYGNLTKEINPLGGVSTYTYNDLNYLISEKDPSGKTWNYEYDKMGNKTRTVDPKGQVIRQNYDSIGRITAKEFLDGDQNPQQESVYYSYDNVGNIISVNNSSLTNNFTYDNAYRMTNASDSRGYSMGYEYNNAGNVTKQIYPDQTQVEYIHNGENYISNMFVRYSGDSLTQSSGISLMTRFTYDLAGNLVRQTNPNGTGTQYVYGKNNQLINVNTYKHLIGKTAHVDYFIARFAYTLNANQDRVSTSIITNCDKDNNCSSSNTYSSSENYTYDKTRRVKSVIHTSTHPEHTIDQTYTTSYNYDGNGNRLSMNSNRLGGANTINYTYNENNQLLSENDWTYSYDDNGNQVSKNHVSSGEFIQMGYDRDNQLTSVNSRFATTGSEQENYLINYNYDGLGRRIGKVNANAGPLGSNTQNEAYDGVESQEYVYEKLGFDLLADYTKRVDASIYAASDGVFNLHTNHFLLDVQKDMPIPVAMMDVAEREVSSLTSTWSWEQRPGGGANDWLVTPDSNQRFSYLAPDGLGSVVAQTGIDLRYEATTNGGNENFTTPISMRGPTFINQHRFDEYGNKLNNTKSSAHGSGMPDFSSRQYSGQIYDVETKFSYYGSRYYDAANGTWNKLDSYRGRTNHPSSRNRYAFVDQNPVNNVDVYGFSSQSELDSLKQKIYSQEFELDFMKRNYDRVNLLKGINDQDFKNYQYQAGNRLNWQRVNIFGIFNNQVHQAQQEEYKAYGNYIESGSNYLLALNTYTKAYGNLSEFQRMTDRVQAEINTLKSKKDELERKARASSNASPIIQRIKSGESSSTTIKTIMAQNPSISHQKWDFTQTADNFNYVADTLLSIPFRIAEKAYNHGKHGKSITTTEYQSEILGKAKRDNQDNIDVLEVVYNILVAEGFTDAEYLNVIQEKITELKNANQEVLYNRIRNDSSTAIQEGQSGVFSEIAHTALDAGGMIPIIGEPIDVVHGIIYALEGDGVNAGLSIAAAIPILGNFTTAGKTASKLSKVGKTVDTVEDVASASKLNIQSSTIRSSSGSNNVIGNGLKYSSNNFARNLNEISPKPSPNHQAHHVFPQQKDLAERFNKAGIDIHHPKYGSWWDATPGKKGNHSSMSKSYNNEWDNWFRRNKEYSKSDVLDQGKFLMKKYGQDINF